MSKGPVTPEATNYAEAEAYIKAGRDPESRPLKDGWNTKMVKVSAASGDPYYEVRLHDSVAVRYHKTGQIDCYPKPDFVRLERIQRYALADKYLIRKVGTRVHLFSRSVDVAHGIFRPVGMFTFLMEADLPFEIDATGMVTGAPAPSTSLSRDERRRIMSPLRRQYIINLMKRLASADGLPATEDDMKLCDACLSLSGLSSEISVADAVDDNEHLFAHILEGVMPPRLVLSILAPEGPSFTGYDGFRLRPNAKDIPAITSRITAYLNDHVK